VNGFDCLAQPTCKSGQHLAGAGPAKAGSCKPQALCQKGQRLSQASALSAGKCETCVSGAFQPTGNHRKQACQPHGKCKNGQFEVERPTAYSDRVCGTPLQNMTASEVFVLLDMDGDGIISGGDVESFCSANNQQEGGTAGCNATSVAEALSIGFDGTSQLAFVDAFNPRTLAEAGIVAGRGNRSSANPVPGNPIAVDTDTCRNVKCAVVCEDECGWSRPNNRCEKGLQTSQTELEERLGDCTEVTTAASEAGSDATSTILGVLVGVGALIGLGVLGVYVWRRWTPLESGNAGALSFFNAAYTRSTGASSDGELYTEGGSGAVGDGDMYSEQPALPGSRVHHLALKCKVGLRVQWSVIDMLWCLHSACTMRTCVWLMTHVTALADCHSQPSA
jgi:hypothetical protein